MHILTGTNIHTLSRRQMKLAFYPPGNEMDSCASPVTALAAWNLARQAARCPA